jgi:hypothetical protein
MHPPTAARVILTMSNLADVQWELIMHLFAEATDKTMGRPSLSYLRRNSLEQHGSVKNSHLNKVAARETSIKWAA